VGASICGVWRCADGFTDKVIRISKEDAGYLVSATDENDGEQAEIYEIREDQGALRFCAHWPSNGRFVKYRFLVTDQNIADVTYSYSAQETWLRAET
jgi:hypothetical protein